MAADWTLIHAERASLAQDLAGLDEARWVTPSLCEAWTVHQALAHLTSVAKMTPGRFFTNFAGAKLKFNAMNDNGVRTETRASPAETLASFRSVVSNSTAPPGPGDTALGEVLVHAEDIRRPLGIHHVYPQDAVEQVARFYAGSNVLIGGKRRVAGVTLRPTDGRWSLGAGPVVEGPAMSLVLAVTGRRVALTDLSGPGLEILAGEPR